MARKKANIHYIYKTTCNVTNKWYVGMHSTSNENDGYMGSGKVLRYSIRKYGVENHIKEILEYLPTREALVLREIEIVTTEFIQDKMCMNLKEGGSGGWYNEEVQLKCSIAGGKASMNKYWTDENYRQSKLNGLKKAVAKLKELGSDCVNPRFEGKLHSEETKKFLSEQRKGTGIGEKNSQYGTCWITNGTENKKIKKEELDLYLSKNWIKGRK